MQNSIARLAFSCLTLLLLLTASCAPAAPQEEEAAPAEEEEVATEEEEAATPGQIEASDGQVTIILDKVERGDVMPPDIVEVLTGGRPSDKVRPPHAGCDLVCIYLTISRIEGVHMLASLRYGKEVPMLLDAQGGEYEPFISSVQGISWTAPYEALEGATAFLVFDVPVQEEPSELTFVYSFKETWEDESAKRGQIDIGLG